MKIDPSTIYTSSDPGGEPDKYPDSHTKGARPDGDDYQPIVPHDGRLREVERKLRERKAKKKKEERKKRKLSERKARQEKDQE